MAYNQFNPQPQTGSGIFGLVPGQLDPISAILANPATLGAPQQVSLPNPFGDLSAIYPNLGKTNNALSALIASQISGELSPQEQASIQDARARYGVASGMAGSGLNRNATVRDLGLATGQRQQQGLANYGNIIPTISRTQTVDPALQAQINTRNANAIDNIAQMNAQFQNQFSLANTASQNRANEFNSQIADRNATFAASPNPEQAQNYALKLFNDYLAQTQGAAGGGQAFRSLQGGGGQTGLGTPQTQTGSFGSFMGPQTTQQPAWGGVFSGTGQGVIGGGSSSSGSGGSVLGGGSAWTPSDLAFTGLDEMQSWAPGTRDPFQAFEQDIPQSGTPNNWSIWDQSPMWT